MARVLVFDPKTRKQIAPANEHKLVAIATPAGVHMLASARKDKDPRYEGLESCRRQSYGVCY